MLCFRILLLVAAFGFSHSASATPAEDREYLVRTMFTPELVAKSLQGLSQQYAKVLTDYVAEKSVKLRSPQRFLEELPVSIINQNYAMIEEYGRSLFEQCLAKIPDQDLHNMVLMMKQDDVRKAPKTQMKAIDIKISLNDLSDQLSQVEFAELKVILAKQPNADGVEKVWENLSPDRRGALLLKVSEQLLAKIGDAAETIEVEMADFIGSIGVAFCVIPAAIAMGKAQEKLAVSSSDDLAFLADILEKPGIAQFPNRIMKREILLQLRNRAKEVSN